MAHLTTDLITGARIYRLSLSETPFRSRLGDEGEMAVFCDRQGRITDVRIALRSPRDRFDPELDRLAADSEWTVPVEELRAAPNEAFVVDLRLGAETLAGLAGFDMDDSTPEAIASLPPLRDEANYELDDIRDVV